MKKQLTLPKMLHREMEFDRSAINEEERTVEMSISSDAPYKRWFGTEILDHGSKSVCMDRVKAGAPLLFNHDRDAHIGTIVSAKCDGKNLRIKAKFGSSQFANEKFKDVQDGILTKTSVGYQVTRMVLEEENEKEGDTYRVMEWTPYEGSLVTIPADDSVGVGRADDSDGKTISVEIENAIDTLSENTKTHETKQKPMSTPAPELEKKEDKADLIKVGQDAVKIYMEGCNKIDEWMEGVGKNHPDWREALLPIANKHKQAGADFDAFTREAVPAIPGARPVDTPHPDHKLGMSKKDRRDFSLRKAILETAMQNRGVGQGPTGIEKEAIDAAVKLYSGDPSRSFSGNFIIPDDMRYASIAEDNDMGTNAVRGMVDEMNQIRRNFQRDLSVSVFSAGGALVGTDLLAGSMIDILRNAVLIGSGPLAITELSGLIGNVAIPKQTGTGTVYWLAEGASVTESDQTFAQLTLVPHRMGCDTAFTKQLLIQSTPSVEQLVRTDIALNQAVEEDRATILGSGASGEPLGIFNTTGILANVTFGGVAVWGDMVNLEYGLENANIRTGQMAILTSPLVKSYLKQSTKILTSTFPVYIWENNSGFPTINGVVPGTINDYPAYATKNVTSNQMCQGVFKNVIKARWGGMDTVVDPYTGKKTETIEITVHQWLDIGLRYPTAFNVSVDAPTSP